MARQTRMHSSRMRTGHSLTVCRSLLPGGVSFAGGLLGRGVSLAGGLLGRGWYPSMHWGRPPLVDRITDTSKNITLATTSLRPVKIVYVDPPLQTFASKPILSDNTNPNPNPSMPTGFSQFQFILDSRWREGLDWHVLLKTRATNRLLHKSNQ